MPAGILLWGWKPLRGLVPPAAVRDTSRPEGEGGRDWDSTRLAPVVVAQ
jgi:hypothetical protein